MARPGKNGALFHLAAHGQITPIHSCQTNTRREMFSAALELLPGLKSKPVCTRP